MMGREGIHQQNILRLSKSEQDKKRIIIKYVWEEVQVLLLLMLHCWQRPTAEEEKEAWDN